jgi:hypothetical protein
MKKILNILISTFILSIIGLYNGYPLVYSDTGTYIYSGLDMFVPVDRPISYGLFINFFSLKYSTWFVIIVQNILTAYIIYKTLKIFFEDSKFFDKIYYLIILFLTTLTGIGWYSNQLMPDFFSYIVILSIFVLLVDTKQNIISKFILILMLIYGMIVHFSHLLIGITLVTLIICSKIIFREKMKSIKFYNIFFVSLIVLSSWFILPSINYLIEKKFILSKGTHVFLMSHLNDTGILKQFLDENCNKSEFKECKLCLYKDSLPVDLASFIWSSGILEKTGGWENSREEYNKIIKAILTTPKYLILNIYRSFTYGLIQLTQNKIGEGLTAYNNWSPPYSLIKEKFHNELNNYLNSKQNKWNGVNLKLDLLNTFHTVLIIISVIILLTLLTSPIIQNFNRISILFALFIIISITLNSFITAGLNSPCERFQARVVWLLPFSTIILIIKNYRVIISSIYEIIKANITH